MLAAVACRPLLAGTLSELLYAVGFRSIAKAIFDEVDEFLCLRVLVLPCRQLNSIE